MPDVQKIWGHQHVAASVDLLRSHCKGKSTDGNPSVCLFFFFFNLNLSHLFFQSVVLIRGPLRHAASQHVLQFAILWFCDSVWRNQLLWGLIHAITRVSAGLQEFQASELANVQMYTFTPLQMKKKKKKRTKKLEISGCKKFLYFQIFILP